MLFLKNSLIFGCGHRGHKVAFSSPGEEGLLSVVVSRLLVTVASLVVEHRRWGTQASVVELTGLVALRLVGSPQTRDRTCGPLHWQVDS